jgi:hypothetical protein
MEIRTRRGSRHWYRHHLPLIDELPRVLRRLPDPEKQYKALTHTLNWDDGTTFMIAQQVLDRLRNGKPLETLLNVVPCSTFTLYRVAAELYKGGQIG